MRIFYINYKEMSLAEFLIKKILVLICELLIKKSKMKNIVFLLVILSSVHSYSQDKKDNLKENDFYSLKSQYFYDSFVKGEIHTKDGRIAEAELNYNILVDELHYIEDDVLKTFSENDIQRIAKIVIGNKQFIINDNTVYEVLYSDKIVLLKKRTAEQGDVNQNSGAYGTTTNTSSNTKITALSHAIGHEMEKGAIVNIKDELNDIEIKLRESFKILYNNQIYNANKKTFYTLYPDKENKIKAFIKENKIKFKTPEEIVTVIDFCNTLF